MVWQSLIMADGTVFQDSYAREGVNGISFVYIQDPAYDIKKALAVLQNKEATRRMVYHYYKVDVPFEGYTKLTSIRDEGTRIIAVLKKGENTP